MKVWDVLFPRLCVGCGRMGSYVCSNCVNRLRLVEKQVCPMCGEGSVYGKTHFRCERKWGMDGVVRVFEYWEVARGLVTKLKYRRVRDLFPVVVEAMVSLGDFAPLERKKWLVVAVPLHKSKLRERGFNQAEMLAEAVADYFGWEWGEGVLVRRKKMVSQTKLKGKERLKNVRGVFQLNSKPQIPSSKLKGKRVLIVDDVWTTGATMRECGKVLKRAGVREVWGLVVAS